MSRTLIERSNTRCAINLILLFENDFLNAQTVRLSGRRQQHILDVQRVKKGQELVVGRLQGRIGTGRVTEFNENFIEMEVRFFQDPPVPLAATLILALPRPIVLKRILADASALGVKKIYLVNSFRVEKSFWRSHVLEPDKITRQLSLGLEQGRDTVLPEVFLKHRFKPFVEDDLPHLIKGQSAWVAHPEAPERCPAQIKTPATVFIGPEGGFIPFEMEALGRIGFQGVQLGPRILRVETAIPFLLSRLVD